MGEDKTLTEEKEGVGVGDSSRQNFRGFQEVEKFYRFIYENDLRRETAKILKLIQKGLNLGKKAPKTSKEKKLQ